MLRHEPLKPPSEYELHHAIGVLDISSFFADEAHIDNLQGFCLTVARSPGAPHLRSRAKQISEQVAQTGALLDSSSLSCKFDPSWN